MYVCARVSIYIPACACVHAGRSWPAHPVPREARLCYSVDTWSNQIQHFLESVVREPAYLIGNSLGGYLSVQVASSFPAHVKGLILLNATPFWGFRPNSGAFASSGSPAADAAGAADSGSNGTSGRDAAMPPAGLLDGLDGTVPISRGVKSVIEKFWWDTFCMRRMLMQGGCSPGWQACSGGGTCASWRRPTRSGPMSCLP